MVGAKIKEVFRQEILYKNGISLVFTSGLARALRQAFYI